MRAHLPLNELVLLLALGCAVGAVLTFGSPRAFWLGGAALALGLMAGLEMVVREHFSGRSSQAPTLGGAAGCVAALLAFLNGAPPAAGIGAGLLVFALCAGALAWQFRRRRGRA
jgi:hypothetical protein